MKQSSHARFDCSHTIASAITDGTILALQMAKVCRQTRCLARKQGLLHELQTADVSLLCVTKRGIPINLGPSPRPLCFFGLAQAVLFCSYLKAPVTVFRPGVHAANPRGERPTGCAPPNLS